MTETEIARFRRRIADKPSAETDIITIDTNARVVELRFGNVYDVIIYVDDSEVTSGFEVDGYTGTITFDESLDAGSELRVDYKHVAYSDEEIDELIVAYGFDQAVIEVLEELLIDSAKMYDYSEGATGAKLSQVFDHLNKMLERYRSDATDGAFGAQGGVKVGKRINPQYQGSRRTQNDISRGLT